MVSYDRRKYYGPCLAWRRPTKHSSDASAGNSGDNFEIDLEEGGFTDGSNLNDNAAWHFETQGAFGGVTNVRTNLTSGFNTCGSAGNLDLGWA